MIPLLGRAWHGECAAVALSVDVRGTRARDRRVRPAPVAGDPGAEHGADGVAHLPERRDVGPDGLPAVVLGHDPDPGAGRRHWRQAVGLRGGPGRPGDWV